MRKNELLKLLSETPGNPDIKLWNGFVSDWQDFGELIKVRLVKVSFNAWVRAIENERIVMRKDGTYRIPDTEMPELRSLHKKMQYEHNEFVEDSEIAAGTYSSKQVYVVQPKRRNKTSWDRLGKVQY